MLCGSPKLRAPTIIYLYRRHFALAQLITSLITLLEESHMGWLHPWPSRSFVRKLNTSTLSRTWVAVRSEQNRTQNLFLFACPPFSHCCSSCPCSASRFLQLYLLCPPGLGGSLSMWPGYTWYKHDFVRNIYKSQMIAILNEFMLWCELTSSPWALASVFGMSIIRLSSPAPLPEIKVLYHISKDVMYWARTYINDIVFNSEHIVDGLEWGDGGVAGLVHLRCLVDNSNLPELKGTFE